MVLPEVDVTCGALSLGVRGSAGVSHTVFLLHILTKVNSRFSFYEWFKPE